MKNDKNPLLVTLILLLIFPLIIFTGCTGALDPIEVTLSFSESPLIGKLVEVTATFTNRVSLSEGVLRDVEASISLPNGIQLLDGDLSWKGDLLKDQPQTIQVTVKTIQLGTYKIHASAHNEINNARGFDWLYVTVTENGATISKTSPTCVTNTPYKTSSPYE